MPVSNALTSGKTKSCGCYQSDAAAESNRSNKLKHGGCIHGYSSTEYATWIDMKRRGEEFVFQWNDFSQFIKDIGWRPSSKHRLARRDIREPHGPTNTYWRDINEDRAERAELDIPAELCIDIRGELFNTTTEETTSEREGAQRLHSREVVKRSGQSPGRGSQLTRARRILKIGPCSRQLVRAAP